MKPKQIIALALAVLLFVIVVQNSEVAVIRLLFWKVSMSMIILLFLVTLMGFAIGWLTRHHVAERKKRD
jgi:uncharacterized integral membrane protein